MIVKKEDVFKNRIEKARGGEGIMIGNEYLRNADIKSKLGGFNIMNLEPDGSVGFHQHIGNEEVYYIISGKGIAKDNDNESDIGPGDLIFTGDGNWHGIKNTGAEMLVFAAFIVGI